MEDDPKSLTVIGETWADILEPIPDRWLNECFKLAAKDAAVDGKRQVTPGEMIRAWHTLNHDGTVAKHSTALPEGPKCEFCNGTGHLYRDKQGNKLRWSEIITGVGVERCQHET